MADRPARGGGFVFRADAGEIDEALCAGDGHGFGEAALGPLTIVEVLDLEGPGGGGLRHHDGERGAAEKTEQRDFHQSHFRVPNFCVDGPRRKVRVL